MHTCARECHQTRFVRVSEQVDGEYRVKLMYNPDPEFHGFDTEDADDAASEGLLRPCPYIRVPRGDVTVDWATAPVCTAGVPLREFEQTLMTDRRSFATVHEWEQAASGASDHETDTSQSMTGTDACLAGTARTQEHSGPLRACVNEREDREAERSTGVAVGVSAATPGSPTGSGGPAVRACLGILLIMKHVSFPGFLGSYTIIPLAY